MKAKTVSHVKRYGKSIHVFYKNTGGYNEILKSDAENFRYSDMKVINDFLEIWKKRKKKCV